MWCNVFLSPKTVQKGVSMFSNIGVQYPSDWRRCGFSVSAKQNKEKSKLIFKDLRSFIKTKTLSEKNVGCVMDTLKKLELGLNRAQVDCHDNAFLEFKTLVNEMDTSFFVL